MTTLSLYRGDERAAVLTGPREAIDAIATAAGLSSRGCVDDRLGAIDLDCDATLVAAAWSAGYSVAPTCALCDASKRGGCAVHRVRS